MALAHANARGLAIASEQIVLEDNCNRRASLLCPTQTYDDLFSHSRPTFLHKLEKSTWTLLRETFACTFVTGFHPYVRLHILKTDEAYETVPVRFAESDFSFTEGQALTTFCLPKHMSIENVEIRGILADAYFNKDKVIGFAKTDLGYLAKYPNQDVYLKLITEEEVAYTGTIYLQVSYSPEAHSIDCHILGCRSVRIKDRTFGWFNVVALLAVISIALINAGIMYAVEGGSCPNFDDFSQCLWFTVVTFGSVGYGDMYPCTDTGRIVNGLIIIFNQVSLAILFNISIKLMLLQYGIFRHGWLKVEKLWVGEVRPKYDAGMTVLCQDENGDRCSAEVLSVQEIGFEEDVDKPIYEYTLRWAAGPDMQTEFRRKEYKLKSVSPLTFRKLWTRFIKNLLLTMIFLCIIVTTGMLVLERTERDYYLETHGSKLSYANTFHFCIVTMATVGYGDWAPATSAGRCFGGFFLIFGVILLAHFASIVIDFYLRRQELINSTAFLNDSLVTPEQLLDFDMNGDQEITKYEYLVKSLLACKFVCEDKIDLIMEKFMDIDTDKSGSITVDDFLAYTQNARTSVAKPEKNSLFLQVACDIMHDMNPKS